MYEYGDAVGIAITETGEVVAHHISSNESFSAHDLLKEKIFDEKFPEGWTFEFVRIRDDRDNHAGLKAALKLYDEKIES
jgi:hypothetical protein